MEIITESQRPAKESIGWAPRLCPGSGHVLPHSPYKTTPTSFRRTKRVLAGRESEESEVRGAGENRNCKASLENLPGTPPCSLCCQLPCPGGEEKQRQQEEIQYRRATFSQHRPLPGDRSSWPTSLWSTAALHVNWPFPADGRPPISFLLTALAATRRPPTSTSHLLSSSSEPTLEM